MISTGLYGRNWLVNAFETIQRLGQQAHLEQCVLHIFPGSLVGFTQACGFPQVDGGRKDLFLDGRIGLGEAGDVAQGNLVGRFGVRDGIGDAVQKRGDHAAHQRRVRGCRGLIGDQPIGGKLDIIGNAQLGQVISLGA